MLAPGASAAAVPPGAVALRAFEARRGKPMGGEGAAEPALTTIQDLADAHMQGAQRYLERRKVRRSPVPLAILLALVAAALAVAIVIEIVRGSSVQEPRALPMPSAPSADYRLEPPPPVATQD